MFAHHQHGAMRMSHHALGRAAEEKTSKPGPAVRRHHDQIDVFLLRCFCNLLVRRSTAEIRFGGHLRRFVLHELIDPLSGILEQALPEYLHFGDES